MAVKTQDALIAGGVVLAAYLLLKAKKAHQPAPAPLPSTLNSSGLSLTIVRISGYAPLQKGMSQGIALQAGSTYQLQATVKNLSTRGGVATPAVLSLALSVNAGGVTYLTQAISVSLAAGEQKVVGSVTFTIPAALASSSVGTAAATLTAPDGTSLGQSSVAVDVLTAPTLYAASVTFTPSGSGGATPPAPVPYTWQQGAPLGTPTAQWPLASLAQAQQLVQQAGGGALNGRYWQVPASVVQYFTQTPSYSGTWGMTFANGSVSTPAGMPHVSINLDDVVYATFWQL